MIDPPVDDLMQEFLTEAAVQLDALHAARKRVGEDPRDAAYQKALLELVHTTKGACGFLPLPRLEAVATAFAVLVDDIHAGKIEPGAGVMMLIMGVLDRFRDLLEAVDENGVEPAGDDMVLIRGLEKVTGVSPARPVQEPTAQMPPAPQAPVPQIPVPQAAIPEPRVGFALYRLGDRVKAFDLAHVEWLDLIETLIADDHGGGIVVPALEEAVDLAPHDEVAARNPSGPWPLIVLGKDGRRIGLIVDEVIDVVESLDPEIEIVEPDSVFAAGTD